MINNQLKKIIKSDQRGVILVFTLILMALLLTIALSFSYFIISDINKARSIDNSVIAYYGADAGMEEALYLLRRQGSIQSAAGLKTARPGEITLPQSRSRWNIIDSTDYERSILRQHLYSGQSVKFFILNRAAGNGTNRITVEWHKGDETAPQLQISLTQLSPQTDDSGALVYLTDTAQVEAADADSNGTGTTCYLLKNAAINGGTRTDGVISDYSVELKVLGAADADFIDHLIVNAYDSNICSAADEPDPQGLSNLTIKSRGRYNQAEQSIIAQVLPLDPASGLLGFVLFSDQDITKE